MFPALESNNTFLSNVTCESVLPHFEPEFMDHLCTVTKNDTSFEQFNQICCGDPSPNSTQIPIIDIFRKLCHSGNTTAQMQGEVCNKIDLGPYEIPDPFTVTPATYCLMSLLTPIGVLANLLIIMTVLRCKKLKTTTGFFICHLAIADLLCILSMVAYLIVNSQIELRQDVVALMVFSSMDVFIGSASLLHVTAASVERAIAVAKPMVYPLILSKERAKKVIMLIWLYCSLLFIACCVRVFVKTVTYNTVVFFVAVCLSFGIPCVLVLISYLNISIKALRNLQMEKKIARSLVIVSMLNDAPRKTPRYNHQIREIKLALNLTIMTAPFVLGWGYFMICNVYEEVARTNLEGLKNWFLNMLPYLISCLNPITYLLFTKTLRKEAIKLVLKPFGKFRSLHQRRFSSTSLIFTSSRSSRPSDSSCEARMIQREV
jgi:7 transmembrane receptor (rhodopsin family).